MLWGAFKYPDGIDFNHKSGLRGNICFQKINLKITLQGTKQSYLMNGGKNLSMSTIFSCPKRYPFKKIYPCQKICPCQEICVYHDMSFFALGTQPHDIWYRKRCPIFSSNKIRPKNGSSANAVCQIAYFSLFCYRRQIELTVYRTTCLGLSLSRVGISLPSRLVITRQSNIIFPFYKISWTWKKYQKHLSCTSNYVGYSALRKSAEPFALVEIYFWFDWDYTLQLSLQGLLICAQIVIRFTAVG
jgi:hypothetical protein